MGDLPGCPDPAERQPPGDRLAIGPVSSLPGSRQLTIVECRPPGRQDTRPEWTRFPIARLRYTQATKMWTLYWRDRNLRFHRYNQLEPSPDIGHLLREIDRDPIAIFWG